MGRIFHDKKHRPRALYVDLNECVGQRESPTPYNTLAHRHLERWGRDTGRTRAAMQRHAREGKIKRSQNTTMAFERYEFSDGSMLVFSPNSVSVVDVNCSMSLRAFLQRLGPNFAAEEAHYIEMQRAFREGWRGGVIDAQAQLAAA